MEDVPALPPETAGRWRALRPPLPFRPGTAACVWFVTAILAVTLEETGACTPADPCGADWAATVLVAVLVFATFGALADPWLGGVSGALLAPLGLLYDAEGTALALVAVVFVVAGSLSVVAAVLDARSRRERLALLAHGTPVQVPDEVLDRPLRTARLYVMLCGASLLAAAALGGWVASKASDERARQRRAPVVDATVVTYDEGDMSVTLEAAGRRETVDVYGAYSPGQTVRTWDLGDTLRPVGEPYDASYPGVLPVLALALAGMLARRAAHVRAEVRALRLGAPSWTVPIVPASAGIGVVERETLDSLLVVPVDVEAVGALLWPDRVVEDEDDWAGEDDWEDEQPVEEFDDEEPPPLDEVVVAGRLVPRGLVAVRVGEQWVAPLELARTAH